MRVLEMGGQVNDNGVLSAFAWGWRRPVRSVVHGNKKGVFGCTFGVIGVVSRLLGFSSLVFRRRISYIFIVLGTCLAHRVLIRRPSRFSKRD